MSHTISTAWQVEDIIGRELSKEEIIKLGEASKIFMFTSYWTKEMFEELFVNDPIEIAKKRMAAEKENYLKFMLERA
jgi:hypothetical protein